LLILFLCGDVFFYGFEKRLSIFYDIRVILRIYLFFSDRTGDNPRIVIKNYGRSFEERQRYNLEQQSKFPVLCSAKMLCTFILFKLESGYGPRKVFFFIRRWQSLEFRKKE